MRARPPAAAQALAALVRAELLALRRRRRALLWSAVVAPAVYVLGSALTPTAGPAARLQLAATAITLGTFALGLLGHANALAVARERQVQLRLRCAPVPSWTLAAGPVAAVVAAALLQALLVLALVAGSGIPLGIVSVALTVLATLAAALAAAAAGQAVGSLGGSAAAVNALSRLVFAGLVLLTTGNVLTQLGPVVITLAHGSPVRLAAALAADGLARARWSPGDLLELAGLLAFAAACAGLSLLAERRPRR